ncbi:MAG: HAD hydrolase-like protein [Clostridia bacterium]|nr:HAD hydrolase-like protein [Clostridia bacterium]
MKNKKYLLFDLDGTVADSAPGVIGGAKYALERLGYPLPDESLFPCFLGPPLKYSFMTYAGVSEEKVEEAIAVYREFYRETGVYMCSLYEGAADFLKKARAAGKVMLIASSKPEAFVHTVLSHLGVAEYFDHVSAASFSDAHLSKRDIVARAMAMAGASKDDCVMIGDRIYDVEGAADNGIPCVGIVNGSVFKKELTECGAYAVAEDFFELVNILL